MQLKQEYIFSLTPYQPLHPAAVARLIEDTPSWQQPELRLALEALGVAIPPKVLMAPKLTVEGLLGYCEPFEVEFKESDEDEYPHFWPKVNFTVNFWLVVPSPGIRIGERRPTKRPINWIIQLPSGKLRLCFEHQELQQPDQLDVDNSSDDLQRVRVYKLL